MKRGILIWIIVCIIPMTCWGTPITVSFVPDNFSVNRGDIFNIDIVADIPDPVLGWGLDISFDTSILSLVGLPSIGTDWMSLPSSDADGLAGIFFSLSSPPPPGLAGIDILLATMTFQANAPGISSLTASYTPSDFTEGFPLGDPASPGSFADVIFESASITVNDAVPEPATMFSFGLGLLVLLGLNRRRSPE